MKTRFKIMFLLASLLYVVNVWATDITYIKERNHLNKEQIEVLEYSQKLLSAKNNKITLPTEVYSIVGDSAKRDCPNAEVMWDKAHFKNEKDWKHTLVIPLKAKTPIGIMNSALYVRTNSKGVFHRIVVTTLPTKEYIESHDKVNPDNPKYSGYTIDSNVDGIFIRAFYYDKGKQRYQIEGLIGNNGIIDSKRNSRYDYNMRR